MSEQPKKRQIEKRPYYVEMRKKVREAVDGEDDENTHSLIDSWVPATDEVFADSTAAIRWVRAYAGSLKDKKVRIVRVCNEFNVTTKTETKVVLS